MPNTSREFLSSFFKEHLHFTPTPRQIADFEADLQLVSPHLMAASLKEVSAGEKGKTIKKRPSEWRSAIFTVYNRKVAEHAQLFPIFHSFEIAFRSTVAVMLETHYQHKKWWSKIYLEMRKGNNPKDFTTINNTAISRRTAGVIGHLVTEIDGDNFRDNIVGGLNNGYEFLECCSLSGTFLLVQEHWPIFGPLFVRRTPPLTSADVKTRFELIRVARNDIYHHKSVARMSGVLAAAEELLDCLDFSLQFVNAKITEAKPAELKFLMTPEPRHRTW